MFLPLGLLVALTTLTTANSRPLMTTPGRLAELTTHSERDDAEPDLVILDLVWLRRPLQTAVTGYKDQRGHLFIPLRPCAAAIGFRLQVDDQAKRAQGFLFSPSDRISIELLKGDSHRKGKLIHFASDSWLVKDGDIYADTELFSALTGVSLTWHSNLLKLEVGSAVPIPIITQQQVRKRTQSLADPTNMDPEPVRISTPYKLWSVPSLDIRLNSQFGDEGQDSARSQFGIHGSGDLLGMDGRYSLTSDAAGRSSAFRMSLQRTDPAGKLLGSLRATKLEVGDLSIDPIPLLMRGHTGLGATVTNQRSDDGTGGDLKGNAPANCLVELYREDRLLTQLNSDDTGAYEFKGLLLNPGANHFHVAAIEQDGTLHERDTILYFDPVAPGDGSTRYRMTAAMGGSSLVPGGAIATQKNLGGPAIVAEVDRMVSPGTWMSATAATLLEEKTSYLGLGLNTWRGSNLWHLNVMGSASGGLGASLGLTRRMRSGTFSLEHTFFTPAFRSGIAPELGTGASGLTTMRLDGWSRVFGRQLSYGLAADRIIGAETRTRFRLRVASGNPKLYVANTLLTTLSDGPRETTGTLMIQKRLGSTSANLMFAYDLNRSFLQGAALSLGQNMSRDYRVAIRAEFQRARGSAVQLTGTVYRLLGPVAVGLNVGVGQSGRPKVGIQLSTSLSDSNGNGDRSFAQPGSSDGVRITARVFLDRNQSGKYDKGDTLLEGVGIRANRRTAGRTGADGVCILNGLGVGRDIKVTLDEASLEDPFWLSASPGIVVMPRPGFSGSYDFPVIVGREVDGVVDLTNVFEGQVLAQLLDTLGRVVATSLVDMDGQYVFSRVQQGHYTLRLLDPSGATLSNKHMDVPVANIS